MFKSKCSSPTPQIDSGLKATSCKPVLSELTTILLELLNEFSEIKVNFWKNCFELEAFVYVVVLQYLWVLIHLVWT